MNNKIIANFDNYFNNVLSRALSFDEKFVITINQDNQIILTSDIPSKLIQLLLHDNKLFNKLKEQITYALKSLYPNISEVIIYPITSSELIIKYEYNIQNINEMGIYANMAKDFSLEKLNEFCLLSKKFNEVCKDKSFWIHLFNDRFGVIPDYLADANIENVYKDVLRYLEYLENRRDIRNYTEVKQIRGNRMIYKYNLSTGNIYQKLSADAILYLLDNNMIVLDRIYPPEELKYQPIMPEYVYLSLSGLGGHFDNPRIISMFLHKYRIDINQILNLLKMKIKRSFISKYPDNNAYLIIEQLLNVGDENGNHLISNRDIKDIITNVIYFIRKSASRGHKKYSQIYLDPNIMQLLQNAIRIEEPNFDINAYVTELINQQ